MVPVAIRCNFEELGQYGFHGGLLFFRSTVDQAAHFRLGRRQRTLALVIGIKQASVGYVLVPCEMPRGAGIIAEVKAIEVHSGVS